MQRFWNDTSYNIEMNNYSPAAEHMVAEQQEQNIIADPFFIIPRDAREPGTSRRTSLDCSACSSNNSKKKVVGTLTHQSSFNKTFDEFLAERHCSASDELVEAVDHEVLTDLAKRNCPSRRNSKRISNISMGTQGLLSQNSKTTKVSILASSPRKSSSNDPSNNRVRELPERSRSMDGFPDNLVNPTSVSPKRREIRRGRKKTGSTARLLPDRSHSMDGFDDDFFQSRLSSSAFLRARPSKKKDALLEQTKDDSRTVDRTTIDTTNINYTDLCSSNQVREAFLHGVDDNARSHYNKDNNGTVRSDGTGTRRTSNRRCSLDSNISLPQSWKNGQDSGDFDFDYFEEDNAGQNSDRRQAYQCNVKSTRMRRCSVEMLFGDDEANIATSTKNSNDDFFDVPSSEKKTVRRRQARRSSISEGEIIESSKNNVSNNVQSSPRRRSVKKSRKHNGERSLEKHIRQNATEKEANQYEWGQVLDTVKNYQSKMSRTDHAVVIDFDDDDDDSVRPVPANNKNKNKVNGRKKFEDDDDESIPPIYRYARNGDWDKVKERCKVNPTEAKYIYEKDGTTALHLAVSSTTSLGNSKFYFDTPAPKKVLEALLKASPEAASIRSTKQKYTPLMLACFVIDKSYDMESAAEVVNMILTYAPSCVYVFTDEGLSAVDVHVMSYSRAYGNDRLVPSTTNANGHPSSDSVLVLQTLLRCCSYLADVRLYKDKYRGPLELLYRCNAGAFQEMTGLASDQSDGACEQSFFCEEIIEEGNGDLPSALSAVRNWWVWKWTVLLLRHASRPSSSSEPDDGIGYFFSTLSAASQYMGCPLPVISLAVQAFPDKARQRNPRSDLFNLPLHDVCSWQCDDAIIWDDPMVLSRKARAISLLLETYPEAAKMTNSQGETPLELAVLSGTPWNAGISKLIKTCPEALEVPSKETGLYPFMSAAVASIPVPSEIAWLTDNKESQWTYEQGLLKKNRESLNVIYGLLRSKPSALFNCLNDNET